MIEKSTTQQKLTLYELEKYQNYTIQVVASTKVGQGLKSRSIYCRTQEDGKCFYLSKIIVTNNLKVLTRVLIGLMNCFIRKLRKLINFGLVLTITFESSSHTYSILFPSFHSCKCLPYTLPIGLGLMFIFCVAVKSFIMCES